MLQKPKHLGPEYADQFKDFSIVEAYRHRPPYPAEVFDILASLISEQPRHVLDVGCGTGHIARRLVDRVEWLDAVDFSRHMIEKGKRLPDGDNPHLRWLYGRVEDVVLDPPYALITAGESLHWMTWDVVLRRFREILTPNGYLAIVERGIMSNPRHDQLKEIISQYATNKDYQPYNLIEELEMRGLFQKVGEKVTTSVPFVQFVDDYIESFHSKNGFSRERMNPEAAHAFDQEAKKILLKSYSDSVMSLQVVGHIVWGIPKSI